MIQFRAKRPLERFILVADELSATTGGAAAGQAGGRWVVVRDGAGKLACGDYARSVHHPSWARYPAFGAAIIAVRWW